MGAKGLHEGEALEEDKQTENAWLIRTHACHELLQTATYLQPPPNHTQERRDSGVPPTVDSTTPMMSEWERRWQAWLLSLVEHYA